MLGPSFADLRVLLRTIVASVALLGLASAAHAAMQSEIVHVFPKGDFASDNAPAIQADGKVYGVLYRGMGDARTTYIYCFSPETGQVSKVYEFPRPPDWPEPIDNVHDLMIGMDGFLYGASSSGGQYGNGIVFKYDTESNQMQILSSPELGLVASPRSGLTMSPEGDLYGGTPRGVFKVDRDFKAISVLFKFKESEGGLVVNRLAQNDQGQLCGATVQSGKNGVGAYFCYDLDKQVLRYQAADSSYPYPSSMTFGADGSLWNTNDRGILRMKKAGVVQSIHKFNRRNGSGFISHWVPHRRMVLAGNSMLYGTLQGGHCHQCGVVFQVDPETNEYSVVFEFSNKARSGYMPGQLSEERDGVMYVVSLTDDPSASALLRRFRR